MNLELNWNECWREDAWKPYVRTGAAVLSSALILVSVQNTEIVYWNTTALPGTGFRAAVSADVSGNDFLQKAAETVLEEKPDEIIPVVPVTEEAAVAVQIIQKTNVTERNISSAVPEAALETDWSENVSGKVKEEEKIQDIVPIERIDETVSDENRTSEDIPMTAGITDTGYLIDDNGMIYGISGSKEMAEDGVLVLPADGCSGIAAGALSMLGAAVEEIEIPANITEIQPGAFAGLSELGWIDADVSNPSYSSVDGVLYTADGTGLLTFPAAWTGTFQVPESVRYFAEKAFDGTNLDCIDARACMLEQTGELPETVELLQ